jgi:F-box-like
VPTEALLRICSQLESVEVLRLGCTCKHLASVVLDEALWAQACQQKWHQVFPSARSERSTWSWKRNLFERNGWASCALQRAVVQRFAYFHCMQREYSADHGACAPQTLMT